MSYVAVFGMFSAEFGFFAVPCASVVWKSLL